MMEREDIRKTKMLEEFNFAPKNTKQVITWQFTCDNQFIKQRWVSSLQTLHSQFSKEKQSIQKYFDNIHKKQEDVNIRGSMRGSVKVPWIQDKQRRNSPVNRNSKVIQDNRSQSPKNQPPILKQSPKQNSPTGSEDIVQNFMMLEKVKEQQKKIEKEKQIPVVQQQNKSIELTQKKISDQNQIRQQVQMQKIQENQDNSDQSNIKIAIQEQLQIDDYKNDQRNQLIQTKYLKKPFKINNQANFYEAQYHSCLKQSSFNQRIKAQKRLNQLIGTFIQNSTNSFIQFVNQKRNITHKYDQIKLEDGLTILQIGLIKYKIGYVGTQALTINKKPKIYYNQEVIKKLKKQMRVYNSVWQKIIQYNKNHSQVSQIHKVHKLKIPLCVFIQYKGVCCLAFENSNFNNQLKITQRQEVQQWKDLISKMGFNSQNFIFKKLQNTDNVVCYVQSIKNIYKNPIQKHHNIEFQPLFNIQFIKKLKKQGASTSSQSLQKYIKGIKTIDTSNIHGCSKNQILLTLSYCYFCKYLRKIYRAAQGQIDQLHLINLLLKGDQHISQLFQSAGFCLQKQIYFKQIDGVLFDFIRYYLGIICQVNHKKLEQFGKIIPLGIGKNKKKINSIDIINSVSLKTRTLSYNMSYLDLYQSFANLQKYIINQDLNIIHKSIQIKQQTFNDNHFQQTIYPWSTSLQLLQNTAQLHFIQNDYISCIKKCKQFLIICSPNHQFNSWQVPTPSSTFPVYLLMLKAYSKFSSENFNSTLKEVSENIIYNYGQSSTLLIQLFSFAGLSFATMNNFLQAQSFLTMAIKLNQKTGSNGVKFGQLFLDLARIYFRQGKNQKAQNYFMQAEMIIQKSGKYKDMLNLYMYELQIKLSDQNVRIQQKKYKKIIKEDITDNQVLKQLYKLIFQIGYKYQNLDYCDEAIQKLWQLNSTKYKIFALQLCVKLCKKQNKKIQINKFQQIRQISKGQAILFIEEKKQLYNSLWQMFNQAIFEDQKLLFQAFNNILQLNQISY